jgi:hypothetical protein
VVTVLVAVIWLLLVQAVVAMVNQQWHKEPEELK